MNDTGDLLQTKDGIVETTESDIKNKENEQIIEIQKEVKEKEVKEGKGKEGKEKEGKNRSVSFNRDVHVKRFGEFSEWDHVHECFIEWL